MDKKLLLGSQSPRRRTILGYFSIPFDVASPDFDEEAHPFKGDPEQYAIELSIGKATSLQSRFPKHIIISADTVVHRDEKLYGKPSNIEEAKAMIRALSGGWHQVYTAITITTGEKQLSAAERTDILFTHLTEPQIDRYLAMIEWRDKAGSYAIQDNGGVIIEQLRGCYYNVMGLPIHTLQRFLLDEGIDLWQKQSGS